ncbi:MAG: FecR family protein [Bacteroidetes bacterium]|nr:FecR family protein [Bacteroidota bacterium]
MNKENLLVKWLEGDLNDVELKEFLRLENYKSYKKLYLYAHHFKSPLVDKQKEYARFKSKTIDTISLQEDLNWWRPMLKIAAIFVLGLGIYLTFFNQELTKVKTSAAEQTNILLPYYSDVVINAASFIKYDEKGWDKKRKVFLQGEAFFKVAKGVTFEVKTDLGIVTVLGTQFNVKQRGKLFEVQCFEGLVNVKINKSDLMLRAGETVRFFEKKIIMGITSLTHPSWVDGKSIFESILYSEVLAEFERQFDVTIVTENVDAEKLFTGSFTNNNMELALKSITQPFKLTYNIDNKNVKIFKFD